MRKQGHSALRVKDGKIGTFDPHPASARTPDQKTIAVNNKSVALGEMLKLVEDGVLVRNTDGDASMTAFVEQSTRLTRVIKQAQEALETPLLTVGPSGWPIKAGGIIDAWDGLSNDCASDPDLEHLGQLINEMRKEIETA